MAEKIYVSGGYGEDYGWYDGKFIDLIDPLLIGCSIVETVPMAIIAEPVLTVEVDEG